MTFRARGTEERLALVDLKAHGGRVAVDQLRRARSRRCDRRDRRCDGEETAATEAKAERHPFHGLLCCESNGAVPPVPSPVLVPPVPSPRAPSGLAGPFELEREHGGVRHAQE